jgi:hypothetical protein
MQSWFDHFKWIAKMIKDFPEQEFIGGGEESFDIW